MEFWSSLSVVGAIVFSLGAAMVLYATFSAILMLAGRKEKRWLTGIGLLGVLIGLAIAIPAPARHADKAWLGGVVLTFALIAPVYAFRQRATEGWLWTLFWRGWLLTLISLPMIFGWLLQAGRALAA
ncbi:hypothetical protein [Chitinilyticum litopenaei]|uniref:hypothetical protein n=1 Tax=Chitinilyticum litopenaei TaxID=1121276 RepID=UPI000424C6D0|nr:hypothetical protein [Chitinilyticum litopenaei]